MIKLLIKSPKKMNIFEKISHLKSYENKANKYCKENDELKKAIKDISTDLAKYKTKCRSLQNELKGKRKENEI